MIKCHTEILNLATFLDTSVELKNIHFEIIWNTKTKKLKLSDL
jgi:hypothetical protein